MHFSSILIIFKEDICSKQQNENLSKNISLIKWWNCICVHEFWRLRERFTENDLISVSKKSYQSFLIITILPHDDTEYTIQLWRFYARKKRKDDRTMTMAKSLVFSIFCLSRRSFGNLEETPTTHRQASYNKKSSWTIYFLVLWETQGNAQIADEEAERMESTAFEWQRESENYHAKS